MPVVHSTKIVGYEMEVSVQGWIIPRDLHVDHDRQVALEIAMATHCNTCRMRIDEVRNTLRLKGVPFNYEERQGRIGLSLFAVFGTPCPVDKDPKQFVGELLGLTVTQVSS